MTFIVVPHGGGDLGTRSFELSYRRLRAGVALLLLAALLWIGTIASWAYVAAQAARVPSLTRRVAQLETERERVMQLAQALGRLERQYAQVRAMLGADRPPEAGGLPLPNPAAEAALARAGTEASPPDTWPLAERGFLTREHLGRVRGQHPGIDIAIPEGSPVRAAGAGIVVEAGADSIYGNYIHIRHAGGYETRYGHASRVLVRSGERVERGQTIARSGNTGTSTAPHLHFEIWKDGEPIDPLTVVSAPPQ